MRLWVAIVVVIIALLAFYAWVEPRSASMRQAAKRKVDVLDWKRAQMPSISKLRLSRSEPIIIRNGPVNAWAAMSKWGSREYLSHHQSLRELVGVEIGEHNTFLYRDGQADMAHLPGITATPNYTAVNMSAAAFFDSVQHPNDKYLYWYGRVPPALAKDVAPNKFLWINRTDEEEFGLFMWMSSEDVRPAIHYDSDHNLFVHINGSKRFVLFPPWEWPALYPYPRIHPSWHKSQVSFEGFDTGLFPRALTATAYVADLHPGDMLCVPPYWWHHVESVSPSVSLASWSKFRSCYESMYYLYTLKRSWRNMGGRSMKAMVGLKIYIEGLLAALGFNSDVFFRRLATRWSHMPAQNTSIFRCPSPGQPVLTFDEVQLLLGERSQSAVLFKQIGKELPSRQYADAVMELELADYIESIVSEVLGPQNAGNFLSKCIGEQPSGVTFLGRLLQQLGNVEKYL